MAESLDRVSGTEASRLIDWVPDATIRAIVGSWPAEFSTPRAEALGLSAVPSFDEVVREYLESDGARTGR